MKILPSINVGNINAVTKGFKKVTTTRLIARILGVVQTAKPVEGATASYCEFKGEFQAFNEQGERFCAPKCILPAVIQDQLFAAVEIANGKSVSFCYDVSIAPDATKKIGYGYAFNTLVQPAPADPLGDLLAKVPEFVKPAPAPTPTPETPQPSETPKPAPVAAAKKSDKKA